MTIRMRCVEVRRVSSGKTNIWPCFVTTKSRAFSLGRSFSLLTATARRSPPGSTFMQMRPSAEYEGEEFADICAMRFRPEDYQYPNVGRAFFELIDADMWQGDTESTFII